MLNLLHELGPRLSLSEGANDEAIERAQQDVGWRFPAEYCAFLRASNGAEGMLASGHYVVLWAVDVLAEFNRGYQFPVYCPEVVAFGSDGGGEAFVFRRANARIAIVPFIGMEIDAAIDIAAVFTDFLKRPRPPHWK
jgi:hypothetical protein